MQNCIVVAFGYEQQRRLMFAKCCYLAAAYGFSFVYFVALAAWHKRMFHRMDLQQLSYKDFAAKCYNVPDMQGSVYIEEELREAVAKATGRPVVGVSVCWDFHAIEADVMGALAEDLAEREDKNSSGDDSATPESADHADQKPPWIFQKVEDKIFGSATMDILESARQRRAASASSMSPQASRGDVVDMLEGLRCTGQAFVVFGTEEARNEAVAAIDAAGGLLFHGARVELHAAKHEPASVLWKDLVHKTFCRMLRRILVGVGVILLALITWVFAFYAPYAYYVMSFNYSYGVEPGIAASLAFTMVVVVGNAMMYYICGEVADRIGFQYNDDREVCYMLMYSCACICNVVLDTVVTFYMVYWMMVGLEMATYDGVPLGEVTEFRGRFEAYAMQRSLGQNLFAYSFPSTFLVPFVIEPFATIYLPYKLMSLIVRSHKNISKADAEVLLTPLLMDLSRYADVLLNVMLAALIFFFPGGFTHRMFLALAFSHCVIYAVDHYKVLRCIPSCYFASNHVDFWAQWMLSIPCAIMLSALVFKGANCHAGDGIGVCLSGYSFLAAVTGAFVLHMVVHTIVLTHVVPRISPSSTSSSQTPYAEVAEQSPCSWFSSNPVHCLRSKYVYKHSPPCDFYVAGKAHTLRRNPEIGCYFTATKEEAEDYTNTSSPLATVKEEP